MSPQSCGGNMLQGYSAILELLPQIPLRILRNACSSSVSRLIRNRIRRSIHLQLRFSNDNFRCATQVTIPSGTKLGHYEIRSKIGEGGMGEVYLARDTKLDRKVALKVLPAEVAANQDRMRRFVQEAKAAAGLNHPNIAYIYEIGADGTNFIAMEYIEGEPLRALLMDGKIEIKRVIEFAAQVASGLAAALNHPNIEPTHRPANVPQRYANQALHAQYALHACTFFMSDFVSVENKGSKILIPKQ
jgi:serine/threonine protein kinase